MTRMIKEPSLWAALRLRCPYCGETGLRKGSSWFNFGPGCQSCDYAFEREEGYFTGASWMVNFPVSATLAFGLGAILVVTCPALSGEAVAGIVSIVVIAFGAWFTPYSMAIWLYVEHLFHPLNADDRFPML